MPQRDPAVNLYSADFLAGTVLLTPDERGHYITLLCIQHQQGHLLYEDMAKICGGTIPPKVLKKFAQDDDGLFYNKRLEYEINKRGKFHDSRVDNLAGGKNKPIPPTLEELTAYCVEIKCQTEPNTIFNHYQTIGWRYGKGTGKIVRDWKAAVRMWEENEQKKNKKQVISYDELMARFNAGEKDIWHKFDQITVPGKKKPMWKEK